MKKHNTNLSRKSKVSGLSDFKKYDPFRTEIDPELDYDRYMTLKSKGDFPLSKADVFDVHEEFVAKRGEPAKMWPRGDGCLVVEAKSKDQQKKILSLKSLANIELEPNLHPTFNTCKGVLRSGELQHYEMERIVDKMKKQKVTHAHKITKNVNGVKVPTATIILTFNRNETPEYVKVGYLSIPVAPFVENPRRCFQCQRFGHTSKFCKRQRTCINCGEEFHGSPCEHPTCCSNCGEDHPASSKQCTKFIFEKEVLAIRNKEKVSFKEAHQHARKLYLRPGLSFADALKATKPTYPTQRERPEITQAEQPAPQQNQNSPIASPVREAPNQEPVNTSRAETNKRRLASPVAPSPKSQRAPKIPYWKKPPSTENENSDPEAPSLQIAPSPRNAPHTGKKMELELLEIGNKQENRTNGREITNNSKQEFATTNIPLHSPTTSVTSLNDVSTDSKEDINLTREIDEYLTSMRKSLTSYDVQLTTTIAPEIHHSSQEGESEAVETSSIVGSPKKLSPTKQSETSNYDLSKEEIPTGTKSKPKKLQKYFSYEKLIGKGKAPTLNRKEFKPGLQKTVAKPQIIKPVILPRNESPSKVTKLKKI